MFSNFKKLKSKVVPYSTTSVGLGADPGFLAVQHAGDIGHKPSGRLPLLSTRPAVTFPASVQEGGQNKCFACSDFDGQ